MVLSVLRWSCAGNLLRVIGEEEEKARGQCIAQHTESTVARSLAGTITEVRPYWVWGSAGGGISGVG